MARDTYHDIVQLALEAEGWTITDDPLQLRVADRTIKIDLGAERLLGAEKEGEKIAVEIKSFVGRSVIADFYQALGQYQTYQAVLNQQDPQRTLLLAVPSYTYEGFFQERLAELTLSQTGLRYLVYEVSTQSILTWKK